IRTQFLKRFESSVRAFELSCDSLLLKLLAFVTKHAETPAEQHRLAGWRKRHDDLISYVNERLRELSGNTSADDEDEDILTEEMLEDVKELSRDEYKVEEIINESYDDLETLTDFLDEIK